MCNMKNNISKKYIVIGAVVISILAIALIPFLCKPSGETSNSFEELRHFSEVDFPTPNFDPDSVNEVLGVILHHTAEPSVKNALKILSSPEKKVGTHVVIDTDGTRYIMADPTVVTYHAGYSLLKNREGCNYFTIGIEFQGNTLNTPLTKEQIESGIEYLLPIINTYNIPLDNIVTHQMIRTAYKEKHPESRCSGKVDITQTEYHRFMTRLHEVLLSNIK